MTKYLTQKSLRIIIQSDYDSDGTVVWTDNELFPIGSIVDPRDLKRLEPFPTFLEALEYVNGGFEIDKWLSGELGFAELSDINREKILTTAKEVLRGGK